MEQIIRRKESKRINVGNNRINVGNNRPIKNIMELDINNNNNLQQ